MLKFKVENQTLTRTDSFVPVADSRNYLTAEFEFSDEWTGDIVAVFTYGGDGYQLRPENGKCTVPWEVIKAPGFGVSLFCGDLITADKVYVEVKESGMVDGEAPGTPTPTLWQRYIAELAEENSVLLNKKLGGAVEGAKTYADSAADAAESNAMSYTDTKSSTALASAKSYTDTKTAAALDGAKSYTDEKIASSEIGKLADGAVTTAKIADGAVSKAKLAGALKSEIEGKADRYAISASVTGNTLLLADKSDTQLLSAAAAALTLTLPETVTSGYECFFSFKSGATATTLTAPSGITWTGADCNSGKEFVPLANTVYEVGIRCIGFASDGTPYLSARVGAC